jgi:SWI/SNF-related matrix-associated actin-dependent regulator 1 of chromatin subfamily A
MNIVETAKGFEISFPFDYNKVKEIKGIDGAWFNGRDKVWNVPRKSAEEVERLKKKYGLIDESIAKAAENYDATPELPELDVELDLPRKLFPFQTNGVAYSRIHKRVIIGDQPGLGKTTQLIATIVSLKAFPCLIICPATLKLNWQKEWMDVAGKRAMILSDRVKNTWVQYNNVGMCDVFIVNYESLKKYL